MEYGSRLRFALFAVGGILLLILSIWGVTSIGRRIIGNGSDSNTSTVKKIDLAKYNKQSSFVRLTVAGPIVASEKYQNYQIEVGQNYRNFKVFTGYNKTVTSEQQLSNDTTAYESFLKALKQSKFTSTNTTYGSDETGYCPSGNRYVYQLFDGGEEVTRGWYTTCGFGNFSGAGSAVRALFKAQIPDFEALSAKARVNL